MRLKRSKKFRNGMFSSDKGSQPRSRGLETQTYQVCKAVPKTGWREALTSVNKWALLECREVTMMEERKPPSRALGCRRQREADGSGVAGREGHQEANKPEYKAPHCLLSSSVLQSARKSNTGSLPTLHSQPKRYKSQPNLVIFPHSPLKRPYSPGQGDGPSLNEGVLCLGFLLQGCPGVGRFSDPEGEVPTPPKGLLPALSHLSALPEFPIMPHIPPLQVISL